MDFTALRNTLEELERIVDEQQENPEPSVEDLRVWGELVPQITRSLVVSSRTLRDQVLTLGDRYVLSDDRGAEQEPEETLIATADSLRALYTALEQADPAARDYHARIRHLVVERSLEPGEEPSLEVRRSTAARMALRDRESSNGRAT